MDLTGYINGLRDDLTTAASAGDDQTRRTAAVLSAALEPAVRLALMNALSDLAAEVTASLDDRIVEIRLAGRDVQVVVTATGTAGPPPPPEAPAPPPPPPPPQPGVDGGDISRITLRMLDELKAKAEQAASARGVSLNSWLSHAVQGALRGEAPQGWSGFGGQGQQDARGQQDSSSRLRGWVQG